MVTTLTAAKTTRHAANILCNTMAIAYTLIGYVTGVGLLLAANGWLNGLGVFLLTHSLIYSAYLTHEFMHGTIWRSRRRNARFGQLMGWLNGACYYGFKALTVQHIQHHSDRVDFYRFNIPATVQQLPRWLKYTVLALEWCYFPVVAFWTRWRSVYLLWKNAPYAKLRRRLAMVLAVRLAFFVVLGWLSLKALLLYGVAYIGMITVLRWADAFQHTYEGFPLGSILPYRPPHYEQANTFSNLISRRYVGLNLLLLNFGYHSAHHADMTCPWHSLPQLDQRLAATGVSNYISLVDQLVNYHRFRVKRLLLGQGTVEPDQAKPGFERFYGAIDVSFITLY
ncbi:fatty acid desaturase family protein [Almyronema epifaneia]|uniref:Fatty acid desaturase family protein n=1 Tax=Almyronema epifaneia S1 TaxID=2991925 RepID=A0ABW6IAJ8_9CYAN